MSNCCFLTCIQVSQEAGQVVWDSHLLQNFPQFIVIHTVKGFGIVNKAEVDVLLEFSCFLDDPADVGHLISGSSAFSKTRLNIWKFTVHVLPKPGLENFRHYFTSVWNECNCAVVWAFFGIAFLWEMRLREISYLWTTKNPSPNPLGLGHLVFEGRSLVCPFLPCSSVSQSCLTLCSMDCSTPCFPVLHHLPVLAQTHLHWVSDAIQPFCPLLSPSPASIFPGIRVFTNELALCIRWPKCWSFSFSISPFNEYSGLISFRIN